MQLASLARVAPHSPPMLDGSQEPLRWFHNHQLLSHVAHLLRVRCLGVRGSARRELTGETRLERLVLLKVLGTQLDTALDIGQVQGGFMMTLGYPFHKGNAV